MAWPGPPLREDLPVVAGVQGCVGAGQLVRRGQGKARFGVTCHRVGKKNEAKATLRVHRGLCLGLNGYTVGLF